MSQPQSQSQPQAQPQARPRQSPFPLRRATYRRGSVLFALVYCLAGAASLFAADADSQAKQTPDAQAMEFFDQAFWAHVERSPEFLTHLGIKKRYGEWDDYSESGGEESLALTKQQLQQLGALLNREQLSSTHQISYDLFEYGAQRDIEAYQWRYHNYPINQMFGIHTALPSTLINQHKIDTIEDAQKYIERLRNIPRVMKEVIRGLKKRTKMGIIPPAFLFPKFQQTIDNLLTGAPFKNPSPSGAQSSIMQDFQIKVDALLKAGKISEKEHVQLTKDARAALSRSFQSGYKKLNKQLKRMRKKATEAAGVWKFPKGNDFYKWRLRQMTTTNLTPEEIHQIGLQEVARIHNDMRAIMAAESYNGSLKRFFQKVQSITLPNTEAGRLKYLEDAKQVIDDIQSRLGMMFIRRPKAELIVKRVEEWREASAGSAFYQPPSQDGKRPGIYYINLHNMDDIPTYQLKALAYHEGIPGHHMQISLAQEMEDLPLFRQYGRYTAYTEGWGLYAEYLPKEFGFYDDAYSDFGRLAMELWRACRLVVDTGIHNKRWTREEAQEYLRDNSAESEGEIVRAVDRYIVMPGQATAYMIGMLKLQELRTTAQQILGDQFDLREFHKIVLDNGAMPLPQLEAVVNDWIESAARPLGH